MADLIDDVPLPGMPDTTVWVRPGSDYRDRLPAMLQNPLTDYDGQPCPISVDRRWLWRLEHFLAVNGTNPAQHQMRADLRCYLDETCEHQWRDYAAEADIGAHRQCRWCSDVEWSDGAA